MTKPRLVKVEALFYVFQQVIQRGSAMNFDTASLFSCQSEFQFVILYKVGFLLRQAV